MKEAQQRLEQQLAEQQRVNEENERRRQQELAEQRRLLQETERRQREQLRASKQTLLVNQSALLTAKQNQLAPLQRELEAVDAQIAQQERMVYPMDDVKCGEGVHLWVTMGITGDGKSTLCNRLCGDKSRKGNKGPFAAKMSGQSGSVGDLFASISNITTCVLLIGSHKAHQT